MHIIKRKLYASTIETDVEVPDVGDLVELRLGVVGAGALGIMLSEAVSELCNVQFSENVRLVHITNMTVVSERVQSQRAQ